MNHSFDIDHAKEYGVVEAVFISNFQFWIGKNKANGENCRDGRTWTYNSVAAFSELFPYLTINQVRHALEKLVEKGVLITGVYNERPADRTKWFAFFDESIWLYQPIHLGKKPNGIVKKAKTLTKTDINTDINTDIPVDGAAFDAFWSSYPKKVSKSDAKKAFDKIKADPALLGTIMTALDAVKRHQSWTKDGGQYIPNAATWLNAKRWEDELPAPPSNQSPGFNQNGKFDPTAYVNSGAGNHVATHNANAAHASDANTIDVEAKFVEPDARSEGRIKPDAVSD